MTNGGETLARAAVIMAVALAAGCGSALQTRPAAVAPPPASPAASPASITQPLAPADPVPALVAEAQRHFDAGRQELELGHLERAKTEFNRALEVLLGSPDGARGDPRTREAFDQLVDRISAYETIALVQGDGFTEKTYQAASIDELLSNSTFEDAPPSADLRAAVATDLLRTSHDIPIPLNDRVLACIDVFQGRLRDWFQDALTRGGRYLPMIQSVLRAEGLPLDLAYVPLIESAFDPNALSRARAKGTWQFIRGTAGEYGLKQNWYIDERSNPEKSTVAAAKYLRDLAELFDGDWHLALASYNGGPGLVQRAMARTKITDFWTLIEKPRALPRETRQYVPMILAAIVIARDPAQYGFLIMPDPPLEFDKVRLSQPVDLRRVAEWAGASLADIQALNPELRHGITPVRDPDYELRVPKGSAASIEVRIAESAPEELVTLNWYVVKRSETLTGIANKFGVRRTDLAEANDLTTRTTVRPGQRLIIPVAPTALLAARTARPALSGQNAAAADGTAADGTDRVKTIYLVKSGDTLFSIARAYRTTVDSLRAWNHLQGSRLNIGDRLTIYTNRTNLPRP